MEGFPYDAAEIAVTRLRMGGCYCPAQSGKDLALLTEQLREDCEDLLWTPDQLMAAVKAYRRTAPRERVNGAQSAKPWPDIGMLAQALQTATGGAVKVLDLSVELDWLIGLARATALQLVPTEDMSTAQRLEVQSEPERRRSVNLARRYGQHIPEPVEDGLAAVGGWASLAQLDDAGRRVFLRAACCAEQRHEVGEGAAPRRAYMLDGRPVGLMAAEGTTPRRIADSPPRRATTQVRDGMLPDHQGRPEHFSVVLEDQRRAAAHMGGSGHADQGEGRTRR